MPISILSQTEKYVGKRDTCSHDKFAETVPKTETCVIIVTVSSIMSMKKHFILKPDTLA
jgi:hypothetical protein